MISPQCLLSRHRKRTPELIAWLFCRLQRRGWNIRSIRPVTVICLCRRLRPQPHASRFTPETKALGLCSPMPVADLPLLGMADADTLRNSALTIQGLDERYLKKPAAFAEFGVPKARWDMSNVDWDKVLLDEEHRAYRLYAFYRSSTRRRSLPRAHTSRRLACRSG